jgi:hypothetical protein
LRDPAFVRSLQGGTVITFDGYDADPREITQIPEVLEYLHQLYSDLPFLFYFLDPDPSHGALMHFIAAHGGRVIEDAQHAHAASIESTDESIFALTAHILDVYAFGERYADVATEIVRRLLEPYDFLAHAIYAQLSDMEAR